MTIEFFAECGSNFITEKGPDTVRAVKLIKTAKEIGCTGVKFQYFKADQLWDKDKFPDEYKAARKVELSFEAVKVLSAEAREQGLLFGLSVFDPNDVELVNPYVDYFKIASFEISLFDLVEKCYLTGKRLMLSTGQSDKIEIMEILSKLPITLKEQQIDILHCVSSYPAKIEDCNLNIIKSNPWINGYSDHTVNQWVLQAAVACGAKIIEFHLDLDRPWVNSPVGLEHEHSYNAGYIKNIMFFCEQIEKALGSDDWNEIVKLQDRKYKANPETGLRG